jgi:ATP/ADP translocase
MGLIARSLNLREHEGGRVTLVLLFSFVVGLSRIFLLPAQALFLERYGADNLPFAYLIAAGTTVALSSAFLWLGRKLRPTQLLLVNLVVTTGITALLQLLALVSFGDWPIALLMAWYVIQYSISSLAFWAVALALFDVREGKRLFALVTSGDMLAYVIGGVLIGPTAALIGTINVVTLSALSSMVASAMAWHFVRAHRERFASAQPSTPAARRKFDLRLLRGPYVMLITCYFMLSGVEYIFVDNAFNVATQAYFGADDPAVLAEFFGLFAAATAVANLLFRSLVAGRLIEYFGLVIGLSALPGTILMGAGWSRQRARSGQLPASCCSPS